MKIFVTGATGFVGSHLARALRDHGHDLVCLVRDEARAARLRTQGATIVHGDVTRPDTFAGSMTGCDGVVHLANLYTLWERDPALYERVNVRGTRHVMEAALDAGVEKVVHVSTYAVWGDTSDDPFHEGSPIGDRRSSRYAQSKYEGDLEAWRLHRERGLPLVVLHPATILGPGDTRVTGTWMLRFAQGRAPFQVYPDCVLTCVHVLDVVDAIVRAVERDGLIGERFLVGNESITVRQRYDWACEAAGVQQPRWTMPARAVDALAWTATRLADLTGRRPFFELSEDAMGTARHGIRCDGSKAERVLGLTYRPVKEAIEAYVQENVRPSSNRSPVVGRSGR